MKIPTFILAFVLTAAWVSPGRAVPSASRYYTPAPPYPKDAELEHSTGEGVCEVTFDE